jgi:hypothetical protein
MLSRAFVCVMYGKCYLYFLFAAASLCFCLSLKFPLNTKGKGKDKCKKQSSPITGLEWPREFQEFKVPSFHDNGTGW